MGLYVSFFTVFIVWFFSRVVTPVSAQNDWTVPDSSLGDFKDTFHQGQTVPFAWDAWDNTSVATYLYGDAVADLWITAFNYDQYPYSQWLTSGANVSESGTFTWTININATSLASTAEYVLRFLPEDFNFNASSTSISSSGFIVLPAADTTTTASAASATAPTASTASTTSTTSTTSTASTSDTSTTTTTAASSSSSSGLSTGAKAGVGVGVSVGALAGILAVVMFILRRRSKRPPSPEQSASPPQYTEVKHNDQQMQPVAAIHELPPAPLPELDGGGPY